MIDLTLNSFLHPDLVGLKPPFGTIIERTAENKGGLSTAQTDNNMAMPFALMRPVTVATSDTTSKVEYDAKLLLTGDTPLTIHLDDATYEGCTVTIVNGSSALATISVIGTMNGTSGGSVLLPRNNSMTVLWAGSWVSITETGANGHIPVATGEIKMYMGNTAPKGWLLCNGSIYTVTTYPDLAKLLLPLPFNANVKQGSFYVPDMREAVPVGVGQNNTNSIESHDVYNLGQFKDDQFQGHEHQSQFSYTIKAGSGSYNKAGQGDKPTTAILTKSGYGTPRYGTTTHGKQIGVNYIIKY